VLSIDWLADKLDKVNFIYFFKIKVRQVLKFQKDFDMLKLVFYYYFAKIKTLLWLLLNLKKVIFKISKESLFMAYVTTSIVCLFVCLMVFNATFNNISIQYIVVVSFCFVFFWWRKPEDPKKTNDLSQVTVKLDHILLYTSPWSRFELTTSVVIGTDCIYI